MKSEYKLIGLNKPWKAGGFSSIYATVDKGNEDWFHASFHNEFFPDARLNSLFGMFKNSDENLWHGKNHKVVVKYVHDKPIITGLILDGIIELTPNRD